MNLLILFCGYREWALEIYDFISDRYKKKIKLILAKSERNFNEFVKKNHADLIFFVGWSWIVPEEIVKKNKCICLHPSPLPKYRGGSPLQHQIINGEKQSAVTIFVMNKYIDRGPILWQEDFSLNGNLADIIARIAEKGKKGVGIVISNFIKSGTLKGVPQDKSKATYYKRRTSEQSEIKISDFRNLTAEQIYNKIRALQHPYPNAYVVCKNNTKLFLTHAKIEDKK